MVSYQGGLTSRWSLIRVVSHQGVVSHWGGLIRVVCHHGVLTSGWSLIRVVSHQGVFMMGTTCTLVASHGTSQRQSGGDDGAFFLMELGQKERTNTCEESFLLDSLQKEFLLLRCCLSGFSFFKN